MSINRIAGIVFLIWGVCILFTGDPVYAQSLIATAIAFGAHAKIELLEK